MVCDFRDEFIKSNGVFSLSPGSLALGEVSCPVVRMLRLPYGETYVLKAPAQSHVS